MSDVFISYASADLAVANRVCEVLEAQGVACWMAPRNVRPGDLYADAIVQGINACRLLVVILSPAAAASSHVLREVERASAKNRPLISLRIGPVMLPPALEYFLSASHWLDAAEGDVEPALPRLMAAVRGHFAKTDAGPHASFAPASATAAVRAFPWRTRVVAGSILALGVGLAYVAADRFGASRPAVTALPAPAPAPVPKSPEFSPAPHSVAVLPFVNLSGNPKDEYFSDGLSVELLDALARIRDLQVVARTSSFAFKNQAIEVTEIARKLNVGAILEGSIRKDGKHLRIAANLIDAKTGFRLWSDSFDRDLTDVLKLQTEIATAVMTALQGMLAADTAALVDLGGTKDPEAFDAFLRGERYVNMPTDEANIRAQLAAYDEAIRLDPQFAKAYVAKALAEIIFAGNTASTQTARASFETALSAAKMGVALAPTLGKAHSTLAYVLEAGFQDYAAAARENERALALAPGDSHELLMSARFLAEIGHSEAAVANAKRAVVLDPVNAGAYRMLGLVLLYTHHYRDAVAAYDHALSINPQTVQAAANKGLALLALGDFAAARASCAQPPLDWLSQTCLAIAWRKLAHDAESQAAMAALRASGADATDQAYQYAEVYAQWGAPAQALDWLETAYRVRDPGLVQLKADFLLDPVRGDPRFESILAKLKFPVMHAE